MYEIKQGMKDAAIGIIACFFFSMTITWIASYGITIRP